MSIKISAKSVPSIREQLTSGVSQALQPIAHDVFIRLTTRCSLKRAVIRSHVFFIPIVVVQDPVESLNKTQKDAVRTEVEKCLGPSIHAKVGIAAPSSEHPGTNVRVTLKLDDAITKDVETLSAFFEQSASSKEAFEQSEERREASLARGGFVRARGGFVRAGRAHVQGEAPPK